MNIDEQLRLKGQQNPTLLWCSGGGNLDIISEGNVIQKGGYNELLAVTI